MRRGIGGVSAGGVTGLGRSGALPGIRRCETGEPQTMSGVSVVEGSSLASPRGASDDRSWAAR